VNHRFEFAAAKKGVMKMKRFILLIAIIAMAFTACTKKSPRTEGSTQQQTHDAD
jgi:hypothetical protein